MAQGDIILKHGYDFFAPFRFRADNISYERKFNKGRHAGQEGGWCTMVLPFAATSVTADGAAIEWMHSKTDTKGLWVCNFDEEEDTADDAKLLAGYVGSTFEANVPYFEAPYDGANGTDMRGKTFVFSATNVTVKPKPSAITSGNYHMTVGEFVQKNIENAYFLNAAGSHFVKADNGTVNAFEVYADNVLESQATQLQIVLDEIAEQASESIRGDVDGNGVVGMDDLTALINYLVTNETTGLDMEAANCDLIGEVDMDDLTSLIYYLVYNTWN